MIRSAKITVGPHKYLKRPLNLLYPIEYSNDNANYSGDSSGENQTNDNESCTEEKVGSNDCDDSQTNDSDSPENDVQQIVHPTRRAVIKARQRIQEWLNPDEEPSLGSVMAGVT